MSVKRVQILKASLEQKEQKLNELLKGRFAEAKQSNQKLSEWAKQNAEVKEMLYSIETTKRAIKAEQKKVDKLKEINKKLPSEILELLEKGVISQWERYPNRFFVVGVKHARIVLDFETSNIMYQHLKLIPNEYQLNKFKAVYSELSEKLNATA